ncbi:MAG: PSD1 and planctomycete cytochrome C domain-containing protein [Fuerstiella sp.]
MCGTDGYRYLSRLNYPTPCHHRFAGDVAFADGPVMFCRWLLLVVVCLSSVVVPAEEQPLTFEQHIRPIFRAHCFDCHGATEDVEGGLDLRLVRFLKSGGESGAAITAGQPEDSYLLERLRSGEMPPGEGRVSDAEIAIIERWIAQGAGTARPEPETIGPGLGITPEERSFWSFQPIEPPEVPAVSSFPPAARVRTSVDALVLQSLPDGVGFAPDADRVTLIKRAYFDLIGLPPSPEEVETWSQDSADDWYDRLLTELLASPHYGERWARHWLDVAGYADSEGATNSDAERAWAWKYRDWVIQALNDDKPFDQFVTEQLAGDELAGPQNGDLTPEQIRLLTATGFLRMAADGTGSGSDTAESRNQVMIDTLKIVGTSLLGLSVQCAQCHDHRYDPIPQTDYYALRAVFEPALDWQAWKNPNARRVSLYTAADRQLAAQLEAETKVIADEKAKMLADYMQQALGTELEKFAEPLRSQLRTAYETPAAQRTEEQKKLLAQNPSVNITPGNLYQYIPDSKPQLQKFDAKISEIRAKKPVEEFVRALVEPAGHVPETKLFHRGDHQQPKQTVRPAPLGVLTPEGEHVEFPINDPALPSTGRRLAFARWLTDGGQPLVARVIVNRLWLHHFGTGLVRTPADFGKLGVPPSHPELLDQLAVEFMAQGWSLKKFHRLILTSTVWRQSAEADPHAEFQAAVPFARRRLVRLDAEMIRDRMLAASGQLDRTMFGAPVAIKEDDTGQVIVDGGQKRRSLYVKAVRSRPVAMLQAFDAPVMQTNCEMRPASTVATQSLMLMNGEFTLAQAAKLAERVAREADTADPELVASLTEMSALPGSAWSYGFGSYDSEADRTAQFTKLKHFTGTQWQAGDVLPDPEFGWVLLNAAGGHPDVVERAVIRRWTVPYSGTVTISGTLSHGSPNGNGVRGRIVSSRTGRHGEWTAFNGEAKTDVSSIAVEAEETLDFITDSLGNHTSDSFQWPVTITFTADGQPEQKIVSAGAFRGPDPEPSAIAGQLIRAWELALCRRPSVPELQLAAALVADQIETFHQDPAGLAAGTTPVHQALTNVCQALFSSNEFLYVD